MKYRILFLLVVVPFFLQAQTDSSLTSLPAQWKKVEKLFAVKNYEQTLPLLADIKAHAKKTNAPDLYIRAFLAESRALQTNGTPEQLFEKAQAHFIRNLSDADPVQRSILKNMYALFLSSNSFLYPVETSNAYLKLAEADRRQLIDSIYAESLAAEGLLQQALSTDWPQLFESKHNMTLTPTLYHVLARPYLDFLHTDESAEAAKRKQLLQTLSALNEKKGYRNAESYLRSSRNNASRYNDDIDERTEAILKLTQSYKSDYNAYLLGELAEQYFSRGNKAKALTYAELALAEYPASPWIDNAKKIQKLVMNTEIKVEHDLVLSPQSYHPIKLAAANANKLFIRVYKTTNSPKSYKNYTLRYDSLTQLASIDADLVYEEHVDLHNFNDHNKHHTIYKLNPLDFGNYTLLIANNAAFKDDGLQLDVCRSDFMVTNIFVSASKVEETEKHDRYAVSLIDRVSGLPYANKTVELYETSLKHSPKKIMGRKTSAAGDFFYQTNDRRDHSDIDDYDLYIPEEQQFLSLMDLLEIPEHLIDDEDDREDLQGFERSAIITDRAIYRPGQDVHFKTVLYNNHYANGHILPQKKVSIYLHDANQKRIDSLLSTSNEFGSAHGVFQLPAKTLTGSFSIHVAVDNRTLETAYFSVEEYKRPTFKVTFETNKETYTLADTAVFVGKAESFSGVPVAQANVKYSVSTFNYLRSRRTDGKDSTAQTDQDGRFSIRIPLSDSTLADLEQFTLNFSAEVVSPSGEMQAASGHYTYARRPWQIQIQAASTVAENTWNKLNILTTNSNAQPLKFDGTVRIYRMEEPRVVIPERLRDYFKSADYHLLSEDDYAAYFPTRFDSSLLHDEPHRLLIKSYHFDTRDTSLVQLDSSLFTRGKYLVEAFSVQEGDTVRAEIHTEVFDPANGRVSNAEFLTYSLDRATYQIGDTVTLHFETDLSSANSLYLFPSRGSKTDKTIILPWKEGKASYSFTFSATDIAPKLSFTALLVSANKAALEPIQIPIVRHDNQLKIQTLTFRDKITPGERERWSFKVTHPKKDVAAEVLAGMYDASLDEFASHNFPPYIRPYYPYYEQIRYDYLLDEFYATDESRSIFTKRVEGALSDNLLPRFHGYNLWTDGGGYERKHVLQRSSATQYLQGSVAGLSAGSATLDEVVVVGFQGTTPGVMIGGTAQAGQQQDKPLFVVDGEIIEQFDVSQLSPQEIAEISVLKGPEATALYGSRGAGGVVIVTTEKGKSLEKAFRAVKPRTNLQELAFFYPTLRTDEKGDVSFEFDSPEALSKWKLYLFAHGKNLESGAATYVTQTQKQLMVSPNLPRYFREHDELLLRATVQNLSDSTLHGNARIEFINPETNEVVSSRFVDQPVLAFNVSGKDGYTLSWKVHVPPGFPTVQVKVLAATDAFSDGEVHELAILPNRVLVSDTQPIVLHQQEKKDFTVASFGKENVQAKVQVQSNPILEIIGSLDYLKSYPYECTEQLSSKWFGLKMVQYLQLHYPQVANYFKAIKAGTVETRMDANSKLGQLSAEEMPWLRDIQSDEKKLTMLQALFAGDIASEANEIEKKIISQQLKDGAFPWFDGGKPNLHISIRLLEIWGKVLKLDKRLVSADMRKTAERLIRQLDQDQGIFGKEASSSNAVDYLYARHYWNVIAPIAKTQLDILISRLGKSAEITASGSAGEAAKSWITNLLYGNSEQSSYIRNRIQQEAIQDRDAGTYWQSNANRYNGVSLQSYMVEAYQLNDPSRLPAITQWIYYQKQASHWRSTWMTVDAIYALLLANNPSDFNLDDNIAIRVDAQPRPLRKQGLGQAVATFDREELAGNLKLEVENRNNRMAYGYLNHQYFAKEADLTPAVNNLSVERAYFVERDGKWVATNIAKLGEKIKVRITLTSNGDFTHLHLKDSRPSGVEPIFVASGYQWWRGYYFSMKDASSNYFFDRLTSGRQVLEYEVKANNIGTFQSGICAISSMYDPSVNARAASVQLDIIE